MTSLDIAMAQLYEAFADIPRPTTIEGCPCCITNKEIDVLLTLHLRDIAPDQLAAYASSAFLTVGSTGDYLYFLPRILEISAIDPCWWPFPEVTGRAIERAEPETWTSKQRNALKDYLEAIVATAIDTSNYDGLDSWICAIARIGFDVKPYLFQISTSKEAILAYFEQNADALRRNKLTNSFWELPSAAHDAIVDWFYSPAISQIAFEAYGYVITGND